MTITVETIQVKPAMFNLLSDTSSESQDSVMQTISALLASTITTVCRWDNATGIEIRYKIISTPELMYLYGQFSEGIAG